MAENCIKQANGKQLHDKELIVEKFKKSSFRDDPKNKRNLYVK